MYYIKEISNPNPLLNHVIITNKVLNFESCIYPNLGASLQKIILNGIDIIDGISNNEDGLISYKKNYNSSFLFPFPNRILDGKFLFENTNYELEINDPISNNSLHGHIYTKSFLLKNLKTTKNSATLSFSYFNKGTEKGFPFPYKLKITYTFRQKKIFITFNVLNFGKTTFPFGIGWHPYFKTSNLPTSILDFNSDSQYLTDDKMIPTTKIPLPFKTPLTIKDTFLDTCFNINKPETTFKCNEYTIGIYFPSNKTKNYLQLYIPPTRESIAIEPMTCLPNSFNNKKGLLTLKPNEVFNWEINLNF